MTQPTILIVEDERSIAETLQYALETDGYRTEHASTGNSALQRLQESNFSLMLLDIGLPDISGIELCRKIRAQYNIPVIFLTARDSEIDRVVGLEIGADDYVVKPFSPREVAARVRAVLRRCDGQIHGNGNGNGNGGSNGSTNTPPQSSLTSSFTCDHGKRQIFFFGQLLELSRYEYQLLRFLIARPGQVFSREQLMERTWDEPDASMERTVDAHIKNIRAKCRQIRPDKEVIITHRGVGYALSESL